MHHFQLKPSPFPFYLLSGAGLEVQIKRVHLNFQFSLQGLQTAAEEGAAAQVQRSYIPQTDILRQRARVFARRAVVAVRGGLSSHLSPGEGFILSTQAFAEAIRCDAKR